MNDNDKPCVCKPTVIYVVAMKQSHPKDEHAERVVPCLYFDVRDRLLKGKDLTTAAGSDSILFQQRITVPPHFNMPPEMEIDADVGLFAAVAKTLGRSSGQRNTFEAAGEGNTACINVPVNPGTTRGVVLVFRRHAEGDVIRLIATTDPEIRNGSGRQAAETGA